MNAMLPNGGNDIDYDEPFNGFNAMKERYDDITSAYDTIKRLRGGQIGPEVENFLREYGPLKKQIRNGSLDFNVNVLRPYAGFTYRF